MPPTLSAQEFVARWKRARGSERATAQSHFNDLAHRRLDEAVLDAYGWPHGLGDEEILARLLELNGERAGDESGRRGAMA